MLEITSSLGPVSLNKLSLEDWDGDPRGLLYAYEKPNPRASYVVGCDPTGGIPGWCRALRTQDDYKTDNAAIEVFRVGQDGAPDVQVAEYAAPLSPYDLVPMVNFLGRLYAGASEDSQALLIIEVEPGPGKQVFQELIHLYGYTNFWRWKYLDQAVPTPTKYHGWYANSERNQRELWIRGHNFISKGKVIINSSWLVEEMTDCEVNPGKMRGKAMYGKHDDRVYATLMTLWAIHDWSTEIIPESYQEPKKPLTELEASRYWQTHAITLEEMDDEWEEQFARNLEG